MNSTITTNLTSQKIGLDMRPESFGALQCSEDLLGRPEALRTRFAEEGYLYLPGFFPRAQIAGVRAECLRRVEEMGGLHPDFAIDEAVPAEVMPDIGRRLVVRNELLRQVIFGEHLLGFFRGFFGTEPAHFDHIWFRMVGPGSGIGPHADSVYMNRGTKRLITCWIPYGDVTREIGGLMVLEKSHLQEARLRKYLESDVDTFCANRGPYRPKSGLLSTNPRTLRDKMGGRWLTSDYRMGDILLFGMTTIHASLDNQSRSLRFSSDTRYQRANEVIDPRWVGPDTVEYAEKNRIGKIC